MIKKQLFLFILFLFLIAKIVFGQDTKTPYILEIPSVDNQTTFEKTLEFLMKNNYFVITADKESGFIQCKILVEDNRLLSRKKGEIIHYNFLIRQKNSENTNIYIQANLTIKSLTGSAGNSGYYNDDNGLTTNPKYLDSLIDSLKTHLASK